MADKGPGPKDLIRKRLSADIKRLEFQVEAQELEIMEKQEEIERLKNNIKASYDDIKRQEGNLAALDNEEEGEEVDG